MCVHSIQGSMAQILGGPLQDPVKMVTLRSIIFHVELFQASESFIKRPLKSPQKSFCSSGLAAHGGMAHLLVHIVND